MSKYAKIFWGGVPKVTFATYDTYWKAVLACISFPFYSQRWTYIHSFILKADVDTLRSLSKLTRSVGYHWYRENCRTVPLLHTERSIGQGYTSQAEEASQPTAHADRRMNEGQMQESRVEVEDGKRKRKRKRSFESWQVRGLKFDDSGIRRCRC